jgi:hypothetical protein
MAKHIKLILVSIIVAVLLALVSSAAIPGWAVSIVEFGSRPGAVELLVSPGGGGCVAS